MLKPREVKRQETGIEIFWNDESKTFSEFGKIRKNCSCAICKEAKTPLNESLPYYQRSIAFQKFELVGNYAIEILWGDGHRSIVAFDRLRAHEA